MLEAARTVRNSETYASERVSLICYLIALDLLATVFGRREPKPPLVNLLTDYGLPEKDAKAIYALRCSLIHEFGFTNARARDPDLIRRFRFISDDGSKLLQHPTSPWDGGLEVHPKNATVVNTRALVQLVEELTHSLRRKADGGNLKVDDPIRVSQQHFFYYRVPKELG